MKAAYEAWAWLPGGRMETKGFGGIEQARAWVVSIAATEWVISQRATMGWRPVETGGQRAGASGGA